VSYANVNVEFNFENNPATTLYSDSTSNYASYTCRVRNVAYTTNDPSNMVYPEDVLND
jgi:hypothetical protein